MGTSDHDKLQQRAMFCAAQEQLEEDLKKQGEEGELRLDKALLDRYSALKEEAAARSSKPARDRDTQFAQLQARHTASAGALRL